MARAVAEITAEAVALPVEDRVALFAALSRTLQPPPDDPIAAAWIEEAERRWQEMESGEDPGVPGEKVFSDFRVEARPLRLRRGIDPAALRDLDDELEVEEFQRKTRALDCCDRA